MYNIHVVITRWDKFESACKVNSVPEYKGLSSPQMRDKFRSLFFALPQNQSYLFHNVNDQGARSTTENEVAALGNVLRNQVLINLSRKREITDLRELQRVQREQEEAKRVLDEQRRAQDERKDLTLVHVVLKELKEGWKDQDERERKPQQVGGILCMTGVCLLVYICGREWREGAR